MVELKEWEHYGPVVSQQAAVTTLKRDPAVPECLPDRC